MTAPLLDLALARRIELAEAHAAVNCAKAAEQLAPGPAAAVEPIAGGFAIYCGANSPVTQAVGLGLNGAVSDEDFHRLQEFYRSRNETVRVETCPLAPGGGVTVIEPRASLPLKGAVTAAFRPSK